MIHNIKVPSHLDTTESDFDDIRYISQFWALPTINLLAEEQEDRTKMCLILIPRSWSTG